MADYGGAGDNDEQGLDPSQIEHLKGCIYTVERGLYEVEASTRGIEDWEPERLKRAMMDILDTFAELIPYTRLAEFAFQEKAEWDRVDLKKDAFDDPAHEVREIIDVGNRIPMEWNDIEWTPLGEPDDDGDRRFKPLWDFMDYSRQVREKIRVREEFGS